MAGVLDFLKNFGESFVEGMNPRYAQNQLERQRMAELMKERLFNENLATQRMGLEQDRENREKSQFDQEQKFRTAQAERQANQDDLNQQEKTFQEQLGLGQGIASGAFREPTPAINVPGIAPTPSTGFDVGRTLGVPGISVPAEQNPSAITGPLTGRTVIPVSPEEQAQNKAQQAEQDFNTRKQAFAAASPANAEWLKDPDNADKLNQFHMTGGHFFPQEKVVNAKNQAMQELSDAMDSGDQDKISAATNKLRAMTATNAQTGPGKVVDMKNRDENNYLNSSLTHGAVMQQALIYNLTGELTNLGMMGAVPKEAILNYADEIGGRGPDVAMNKIAYKANQQAINGQLKTFSNISSYENTGKGNIIRALDIAKSIPDSLSPWLNKPLRDFMRHAAGDEKLAGFRTALLTAQNEYARITTGGPTMSGVVSDTARAEVGKALPEDATLGQFLASGKVAVADMEQRKHDSANQIDFLMKNAGGGARGLLDLANRQPDYAKIDLNTGKPITTEPTTAPAGNTPPPPPPPPGNPVTLKAPSGESRVMDRVKDKDKIMRYIKGGAKVFDGTNKDITDTIK